MSKSKLIMGIILIVVGGGLIPTGFFVNQMFIDQIAEGVPDALLAVEEEALPSLEEQLPPLGTPDVLSGVEDAALTSLEEQLPVLGAPDVLLGVEAQALPSLEEQLPVLGTPDVLLGIEEQALITLEAQLPVLATPAVLDGLKDEAVAALPLIINGSGAALAINQTIDAVAFYFGYPAAKEEFFNSPTLQFNYSTPQGVSDYYDTLMGDFDMVNLNYTVTAQNNLLYGVGPLPGLITDLELGMGLLGYMELCINVTLGDTMLNATMQFYYNATWSQLEYLAGYIKNYLWDVVVKSKYSPATIEQYAELVFYSQWANGTVVEDGIDLSLFKDTLPADTKGLEAGIPNPTNLTILICMDLWDDSNSLSFVNDSGILVWVGAMQGNGTLQGYLIGTFSLTGIQLNILLTWLGTFMTTLVPLLLADETGYTLPDLAQFAFYEQWANGTIQGVSVLPDGFLNELSALFAGAPYFEVGLPSPSGLSITETMNLWDEANAYAFVNMSGILVWIGAITNATLQTLLMATFSISAGELTALLTWLGNFLTVRVPQLIEYETGYTIPELAQLSFYEQWANGTIQGLSVLPDGFLNELSALFAGAPYFEVGLPSPSGLSLTETMNLWDETNAYAFVNMSGILVWVGATTNATLQTLLIATFGISAGELTALLTWFGNFLTVRVPQLIEYETGYTIPELAQLSFYEQWANGTIQGLSILPDGFLNELSASFAGVPYFEVGLPSPSGLSITETMNLWDEANAYTFVNMDGILVWVGAITNATLQSTLISTFGISAGELTALLTWLGGFLTVRVPQLIEYETGYTVPELAQLSFYEQWANGTIQGLSILPDGFLSELDPPLLGPPYFEVGLTEGSTGLTASQCDALWDETSEHSLVSASGINKWYNAESSSTTYDELRTSNDGLSTAQMTQILDWLPQFRDEIVNTLGKEELALPMEPYDLGNTLLISLGVGGGALAVLGVILLILSKRK